LPAAAEQADATKPIEIEANKMSADDARRTNVFEGNVVVNRGTLNIRADRIVVRQDKEGNQYEGKVISEVDAKRLFEGLPLLGQKFSDTLVLRDHIPGHTTQDRMVAARFEAPEARIEGRKRFLVRIEEVDGPMAEFSEK